jgi:hypothetical protein
MQFVGQGRCEDVLTCPLQSASEYRFCHQVPEFVESLPSVLASQQTTVRLAKQGFATSPVRDLNALEYKGIFHTGVHKICHAA